MSEHPIQTLMAETMDKIKAMVDANTIIGTPIQAAGGTTIIPVSKVTFGFGAGGADYQPKHPADKAPLCFGGGSGAGVTVSPVCFLVVDSTGEASILPLNAQAETTADRLVEMIPGAVSKVSSFMEGRRAAKAEPPAPKDPDNNTPNEDA